MVWDDILVPIPQLLWTDLVVDLLGMFVQRCVSGACTAVHHVVSMLPQGSGMSIGDLPFAVSWSREEAPTRIPLRLFRTAS